ncbi:MAG: hypothetical protein WC080_03705 [Patescibacteria group bacterium]|jgi:hypothetical protein
MEPVNSLDQLFGYYDKFLANVPVQYQALISIALIAFLIWNIYAIIKNGHWLLIALLVVALPGTWPALRMIGNFLWAIIKGLLMRASLI